MDILAAIVKSSVCKSIMTFLLRVSGRGLHTARIGLDLGAAGKALHREANPDVSPYLGCKFLESSSNSCPIQFDSKHFIFCFDVGYYHSTKAGMINQLSI